jgi:hypothetical protein
MRWFGFAVLLAGCNGGGRDDTDVIHAGNGASDDCGETPPEIRQLNISNEGMSSGDVCGAESRPQIRIAVQGHDEDGDLHFWTMRVWYDETIDGAVDTSGGPHEVFGTSGDDCMVANLNASMLMCVTGAPPFSTTLEFGVVLLDDEDHASGDPVIQVFTTPDEDGNIPE